MATATAKKKTTTKRTTKPKKVLSEVESLRNKLDAAELELQRVSVFFSEVEKFSDLVVKARTDLKRLNLEEAELKNELSELRAEIRSVENLIDSSNDGMLAILLPGPSEFMPLFDRMEKAEPKKHGKNAGNWREKPISVLRLSPLASNALIEADIVFIGQLQDLILADPDDWWTETANLTDAVAAAIADKLNDFISKGGKQ